MKCLYPFPTPIWKFVSALFTAFLITASLFAQTSITGVSPSSGKAGTAVAITGSNFSATAAENIVYFGAVRAVVTAATANSLTVNVPVGATYAPVTVTVNGSTAYAGNAFTPTFAGSTAVSTDDAFKFWQYLITNASYLTKPWLLDADGDGRPDLLAPGKNGLNVWRNTSTYGALSLAPKMAINISVTGGLTAAAIADLDGDGKQDLVSTHSISNAFVVSRNTSNPGAISFATASAPVSIGGGPDAVEARDFDGDGKPDVVVLHNDQLAVFRNTTVGSAFTFDGAIDMPLYNNTNAFLMAADDLDGDGKTDVAIVRGVSGDIDIMSNYSTPGAINMGVTASFTAAYDTIRSIVTGDLDGDNLPEIVVGTDNAMVVLHNNSSSGAPSFAVAANNVTGKKVTDVAISDFNGDGKPDIIAGNNYHTVFLNYSSPGNTYFIQGGSSKVYVGHGLAAGDINGDGKPDLLGNSTVSGGPGVLSVMLNNNAQPGEPVISTITPNAAASGDTVTIRGSHFTGATAVAFGDTLAASFTVVSDTVIKAVVSNNGAAGNVHVTTPYGTANLEKAFIWLPKILSFTPTVVRSGDTITITGTGLRPGRVNAGGYPVDAVISVSTSEIKAIGPHVGGPVQVFNTDGYEAALGGLNYYGSSKIISFSPAVATQGSTITIKGEGFGQVYRVMFGSAYAASFTRNSQTEIVAKVGTGASGQIAVYMTNIDTLRRDGFTFIPNLPVVDAFTPKVGGTGAQITITGQRFSGITSVKIGGVPVASFTVVSSTKIIATVGAGASGPVSVGTANGSIQLDGFTYLPAPTITGVDKPASAAGMPINIAGHSFTGATAVYVGGVSNYFTLYNDSTIYTILSGAVQNGNNQIQVVTPQGTATYDGFAVLPRTWAYTADPASGGPGTVVTISGENFGAPGTPWAISELSFGNEAAASFEIIDPNTIRAVVGGGETGSIILKSPAGYASAPYFEFTPSPLAPVITSFSPTSAGVGQIVTLHGQHFTGATKIVFGGYYETSPAFTVVSDSVMTVEITAGNVASGGIYLSTLNGTASINGFTFIKPGTPWVYPSLQRVAAPIVEVKTPVVHDVEIRDIKVYPNPAASYTWVEHPAISGSALLQVVDLVGHVIKTAVIAPGTVKTQMHLGGISNGYYRIVWSDGKAIRSKGIVIAQ